MIDEIKVIKRQYLTYTIYHVDVMSKRVDVIRGNAN